MKIYHKNIICKVIKVLMKEDGYTIKSSYISQLATLLAEVTLAENRIKIIGNSYREPHRSLAKPIINRFDFNYCLVFPPENDPDFDLSITFGSSHFTRLQKK